MDTVKNIFKGMVIGISNIIPGVSGGTMAVVLGIYDKLLSAINGFFKDWKKSIAFLIQVGIGAALGIVLFSNLMEVLLDRYPEPTNFFFMGLILGSFPILYKRATKNTVKPINLIWFVVTLAAMIGMSFLSSDNVSNVVLTTMSFNTVVTLFAAGFVAAAAMILPGVSGSLVLLILGIYGTFLSAISTFNIPFLIIIAIGVLTGIFSMSKLIESLLNAFPQPTYMAICGLILGSLFPVYPGFTFGTIGIISIISFAVGFIITFILGKRDVS